MLKQQTQRYTPWLFDRFFSTYEFKIVYMCYALVPLIATHHKLSTPKPTVIPISGTVKGYAKDFALYLLFCHHSQNMGMVVLNGKSIEC